MRLYVLIALYIISIIFCYLCDRKTMPSVIEKFYELVLVVIMLFVPVINIIFSIAYLSEYYDKKFSEESVKKIVKKIFRT